MKKLMMAAIGLMMAVSANAQYLNDSGTPFEKGKFYANAGFSGLDLNYNSTAKWNLTLYGKVGYLFSDNWMVLGDAMWGIYHEADNDFRLGAGVRYYIQQNGLYLGAGARYKHAYQCDDFLPNVNLGYVFFLNHHVSIEPELYYDISTKSFKDYSGLGFRVGFGIYF